MDTIQTETAEMIAYKKAMQVQELTPNASVIAEPGVLNPRKIFEI